VLHQFDSAFEQIKVKSEKKVNAKLNESKQFFAVTTSDDPVMQVLFLVAFVPALCFSLLLLRLAFFPS
jgi:hypothetical protein